MINYIEASQIIQNEIEKLKEKSQISPLIDAIGKRVYKDYFTLLNLPIFNNSAMDGILIAYREKADKWIVTDLIQAGNYKEINYDKSSCLEIMTGAKIPEGFDTVIPIEDIEIKDGIAYLKNGVKVKKGQNIRLSGEDAKAGSDFIHQGEIISSKHIGLFANNGIDEIEHFKKFKIGIMATGDELIQISEIPKDDKIIASNLYSLSALIKENGFDFMSFGIIKDNKDDIKERLLTAFDSDIDILFTTGGVSEGKFDFIKCVLEELGAEIIFWKVNIKPGKPFLFAKYNNKLVFSFPGNPVASYVNFKIFFEIIWKKIHNYDVYLNLVFKAKLSEQITKKDKKRHFIRGIYEKNNDDEAYLVKKSGKQSSGDLYGLALANCLIIVPEEAKELNIGDEVECIKI